jgi:N-6 DNA Methylase/Type I restriction enzyme R protein N terminus (HSDR_N)
MNEKNVAEQVQTYLEGLGYSRYLLSSEIRTNYNERIDFVVYSNGTPYIAVEIKSDDQLFNKKNPDDLLFNPYVRQAQAYATFLNAPYYLLTNGVSFLWFTTDDSGRPELLTSPVVSLENKYLSSNDITRVLQDLRDFFFKNGVSVPRDEAAIVIFAKLLYEQGDYQLEQELINSQGVYNPSSRFDLINIPLREILQSSHYTRGNSVSRDERERTYYARAFELINRIVFRDIEPQILLQALDKVFIGEQIQNDGPRVPRWLADFLVRLSQVRTYDTVLDIYSNYGDIAAGVLLSSDNEEPQLTNIAGISPNATSALWAQIQQIILSKGRNTNNILLGEVPPYDLWNLEGELFLEQQHLKPTIIIAAPPFGVRLNNREARRYSELNGTNLSEDLYLELAMNGVQEGGRVTAIIPEGFLVSGNRRNTREFILRHMHITAIVSLGTFLPHSRIKSSILVLDKKRNEEPYNVFLYHVGEITNTDTFDSRTIPQITEALNTFELWSINRQHYDNPNSMTILSNRLEVNNMAVSHYMATGALDNDTISQYATARLDDLAIEIRRGSSKITLVPDGHLPVIGPAMIRPMILDLGKIDHTIENKIPRNALTVQTGDIVLNGISTYAGAAALIEDNLEGMLISRNVMLIRPDAKRIIPEFLALALNSTFVSNQVRMTKSGTVIEGLKVSDLRNLIVPVPSKAIQRFLIERMIKARDEFFQAQDQLKDAEQNFITSIKDLSGWGLE